MSEDHMASRDHARSDGGVREPAKAKRRPKPARGEAWGILNPYGDLWTYATFASPEDAIAHVRAFWHAFPHPEDTTRYKPIRVRVTVSAILSPAKDPTNV